MAKSITAKKIDRFFRAREQLDFATEMLVREAREYVRTKAPTHAFTKACLEFTRREAAFLRAAKAIGARIAPPRIYLTH